MKNEVIERKGKYSIYRMILSINFAINVCRSAKVHLKYLLQCLAHSKCSLNSNYSWLCLFLLLPP